MFKLDMHSLLLIMGVNKLLLGFLMFHLKSHAPQIKEISYWAYGSLLTAAGLIVYAFFPDSPSIYIDFLFSLTLNILITLGDVLFLTGFLIFKGKKINTWLIYGFTIFVTLNVVVFTLFYHAIWIRLSINAFSGFLLYLISAIYLYKSPQKSLQSLFKWSAYLYAFFAFLQLTRTVLGVYYKPTNAIDSSFVSLLLLMLAGVGLILLTYNLIVIIYSSINELLNAQIEHKNRLYSIISHDLRGPISNVINQNAILKKSIDTWDSDKIKDWVSNMEKLISSSAFLLENLFQWSSSQLKEIQLHRTNNDLSEVINECIFLSSTQAKTKNINLEYGNLTSTSAYFDRNMIAMVIRNLLSNAIKFTPENGKISVSAVDKIDVVEVYISDSGIGIEKDIVSLLFDNKKFYSTPGTAHERGSGFGLLICKEFIELHQGNINVESIIGKGSVFSFTLPKHIEK